MNRKLADVQPGLRKGRGIREQIANGSSQKQESSGKKKKSAFALLTMPKPVIMWITTNRGKVLKRGE